MAQLGSPWDYEAYITDSDTEEIVYRVPWNRIRWQRVENTVSIASVSVAQGDKTGCCGLLDAVFPWSTSLRVERNQEVVWDGPVTGWGRPSIASGAPRDLTVRAHDRSALMWKRIVATTANLSGDPTAILVSLMTSALFGTAADPFPFTIPTAVDIAEDVLREYRADRLEKMFDAISELLTGAGLWYTQRGGFMIVDLNTVRATLGLVGERPRLNETSVVDLPGFDVDGLGMATHTYVGGASTGASGYPRIGTSSVYAGTYLSSTLEAGRGNSRATRQYDLNVEAQLDAARSATPSFTIEQTKLSPTFGSELMRSDLQNLLPGCLLDVDFEDTCGFDVPFAGLDLVYRPWSVPVIPQPSKVQITPVSSSSIQGARIAQLDFEVGRSDGGGLMEDVLLSAAPHADWDGTFPPGWIELETDLIVP